MGACSSKPSKPPKRNPYAPRDLPLPPPTPPQSNQNDKTSSPFYNITPVRFFQTNKNKTSPPRTGPYFPPLSPAKHIMAVLAKRRKGATEEVEGGMDVALDKRFGLSKRFKDRYEVGDEMGRGHFGFVVTATCKYGDHVGRKVAVKVIPKAKMTTSIAVEDVRRELKILQALSGHDNLLHFYDAFEDNDHVYIVMELCEGGELLDRIHASGGKFYEEEAKNVIVQILNVVAFCHLQGVVHRDLKPENFLFKTKEADSQLKAIDFGLSEFVKPDENLNDIVGSAYYVAPEVLLRSYNTEADVWSVGVISYILLCGNRPFWARTESGIFRAVLKNVPNYADPPWPSFSPLAKDFVQGLLTKDPRKRLTAAQALSHPWVRDHNGVEVPIDIRILRSLKAYTHSSPLRQAALKALSKTLTSDDLFYLKKQFSHLGNTESVTFNSINTAVMKHATSAMKESRITEYLSWLTALKLDFNEFCAATICVRQLETLNNWEQLAHCAYEIFDKDGNRPIVIEELASEFGLGPSVSLHDVLTDWIRHTDGKLSYLGFLKLLHGLSTRNQRKLR
ncbi:protein kinase superfamily protein [Artemisia annua]|uniref:non-specific serine/threonine protein kinase n=1 Tax=Artemisia annua TaxID=35608 RepID=A0A2U1Q8Z8_ARTAN|nr:protein kinase superfamily protein [Artemisia annua]